MGGQFIWKGIARPTVGDLLDAVCELNGSDEAAEFMTAYRTVNEHADANIGYIIGYVEPRERREALWALVDVRHPIFG